MKYKIIISLIILLANLSLVNSASYASDFPSIKVRYLELNESQDISSSVKALDDGKFIDPKSQAFEPKYIKGELWLYLDIKTSNENNYTISYLFPLVKSFKIYKLKANGDYESLKTARNHDRSFSVNSSGKYLISISSFNTVGIGFFLNQLSNSPVLTNTIESSWELLREYL